MHYETFTTNDGCTLAFQTSLPLNQNLSASDSHSSATKQEKTPSYKRCILLMHGFSGSSAYFTRNFDSLNKDHWVVAPDMRGHGRSGRPTGGYHVARLAADLRDLVAHLHAVTKTPKIRIVPVGCSIGAAILWTYVELFGNPGGLDPTFNGFIFVDQAPLQDRSIIDNWDETKAHKGCYDEKTLLETQKALMLPKPEVLETYRGLVAECLGYRQPGTVDSKVDAEQAAKDEAFFVNISAQCDGTWLARLVADHTRYDHREALELIHVPTMVMAGRKSGCFPLDGMSETVRRIMEHGGSLAFESVYDNCGHWLFYEDPVRFNREVSRFTEMCMADDEPSWVYHM
ncbi:Alpha/Beta hydrolase protein [Apodospora peruviana]|uniref:Alpha/Beta hydrolase protein n=1 Tax=Apodospora peruviana TaxID=516989 RepID=A0AAE0ID62_9PEZI|nr:Alpha/Beta hydrolase protein [Apodospora peruviana]